MISITESAKEQFKKLLEASELDSIQFGVNSGGCSGFSYFLDFTDSKTITEGDELLEFDDVKVVVDAMSLLYIAGTQIDWVEGIMGNSFSFNNPNEKSSCGCNQSFSV